MRISLTAFQVEHAVRILRPARKLKRLSAHERAFTPRGRQGTTCFRNEIAAALLMEYHQKLARRGLTLGHPASYDQTVGVAQVQRLRVAKLKEQMRIHVALGQDGVGTPGRRIGAGVSRIRSYIGLNELAMPHRRLDSAQSARRDSADPGR